MSPGVLTGNGRVTTLLAPVDARPPNRKISRSVAYQESGTGQHAKVYLRAYESVETKATMNPGLSYVAVTWQIAAEAIIPLNSEGGRSIGARAQLLLFLDDLIPSLFGKPLLGR
jgi:hypothetical protein